MDWLYGITINDSHEVILVPSRMLVRTRTVCLLVLAGASLMLGTSVVPDSGIEIIRDPWGIPHIFADSDEGAMYGLGHVCAQDILPWAEFDAVSDHITSLEMLREFTGRTFLLSHGGMLADKQTQQEAIDNRIRYFRNVLDGNGDISYERATQGCTCRFLHQEWLIRK